MWAATSAFCSVWQCVSVCCRVCDSVLQCVAVCCCGCSVLQRVAACCSVLQFVVDAALRYRYEQPSPCLAHTNESCHTHEWCHVTQTSTSVPWRSRHGVLQWVADVAVCCSQDRMQHIWTSHVTLMNGTMSRRILLGYRDEIYMVCYNELQMLQFVAVKTVCSTYERVMSNSCTYGRVTSHSWMCHVTQTSTRVPWRSRHGAGSARGTNSQKSAPSLYHIVKSAMS